MTTLKRRRTNLEPDHREQKRTCSNRFPSNIAQHKKTTRFQNSMTPLVQAPFVVPKRCIHKIVTTCNLTQATCCACLDARPDGFNFVRYIDGHALGLTEYRWQYYCPDCQKYWSTQDNMGQHHRRPLGLPKAKEDVSDAIRISYGAGDVDITRSVDLTLDGLRAEVARLMWCDPRQLMVSDIAMCDGKAVPEMLDDNVLVLRATHVEFKCDTKAESEDDEMEGV